MTEDEMQLVLRSDTSQIVCSACKLCCCANKLAINSGTSIICSKQRMRWVNKHQIENYFELLLSLSVEFVWQVTKQAHPPSYAFIFARPVAIHLPPFYCKWQWHLTPNAVVSKVLGGGVRDEREQSEKLITICFNGFNYIRVAEAPLWLFLLSLSFHSIST